MLGVASALPDTRALTAERRWGGHPGGL